jgi:hypothetical protein
VGAQRGRHGERHGGRGFGGPGAPQQEHNPHRADPRAGDEVAGQDVGRVVDAEVQPGEADEQDDQDARDRQAPPALASEAQGDEQGERAVQSDGEKWEARRRAGSKSSTATLQWLGRPEREVLFSSADRP